MKGSDDLESRYFDRDNDSLFDAETRDLIDRIAQDPRFTRGHEGREVADDLASHLPEERRRRIENAAGEVFSSTVGKDLEREASRIVQRALADPDFDALPEWGGEDPADDYLTTQVAGLDPRLRSEIEQHLWSSATYRERQEQARNDADKVAHEILLDLPRDVMDRLVLCSRNADREMLLADWIGAMSSRRRGWIAYFAHRTAKETEEERVLDRYASAAKILVSRGEPKKAAAEALAVSPRWIEKFLGRSTGVDLEDDDPLCVLAPELIGAGSAWREAPPPTPRTRPKSFSSMTVAEREGLAAETEDRELQMRLAKLGSRRISETLIDRFARAGDLSEDVLRAALAKFPAPWMRREMVSAHRIRPLPPDLALELADGDPEILMDCDDETAMRAAAAGREEFESVLALRNADEAVIVRVLDADPASNKWRTLVDLLVEHPLGNDLRSSASVSEAILRAARSAANDEYADQLLLIACQNQTVLEDMIQASTSSNPAISPEAIVAAALGSYHLSGTETRAGVLHGAQKLWSGADLTGEHASARAAIAERGSASTALETAENLFVADGRAIRCFSKSDAPTYTYVHLHLAAAVEHHYFRGPLSLPALGYQRERAVHPSDPYGPEVTVIVWPLPFQPAIYSLGVSLGQSIGYFAVSDGQTALIESETDGLDVGAEDWEVDVTTDVELRATTESGDIIDNPSEDALFMMLEEIESGEGSYLIVEFLADRSGQTYAQTSRSSDGSYVVEYRDGSAERHYGTTVEDMRASHALITAWTFQIPGWRDSATWEQILF
ncbi:hypothetical protein [Tessaracoccus antarcticus]|uniref:hypothetical protein n=1 Tax=Tessaracoccus antarcticus TaxID=2479848 RepID=UPI001F2061CE|nr:hypothetical protein [Tessaracoccus antarcticus]